MTCYELPHSLRVSSHRASGCDCLWVNWFCLCRSPVLSCGCYLENPKCDDPWRRSFVSQFTKTHIGTKPRRGVFPACAQPSGVPLSPQRQRTGHIPEHVSASRDSEQLPPITTRVTCDVRRCHLKSATPRRGPPFASPRMPRKSTRSWLRL